MQKQIRILPGLMKLLVLRALDYQRLHPGQLLERIVRVSGGTFDIKMSSLVSTVENLRKEGYITWFRGRSTKGQRAIFYQITDSGRTRLRQETMKWNRTAEGVTNVLKARVDPKTREPAGLSSRRRQMKARLGAGIEYDR